MKYLHIVQDRTFRIIERVEGFAAAAEHPERHLTGASIAQNDQGRKISAWRAILFAPTLIGTVYGMNFEYMPELHWRYGYPFAVVLMLMVSVTVYLVFKRLWVALANFQERAIHPMRGSGILGNSPSPASRSPLERPCFGALP